LTETRVPNNSIQCGKKARELFAPFSPYISARIFPKFFIVLKLIDETKLVLLPTARSAVLGVSPGLPIPHGYSPRGKKSISEV
jgi:hypothetical protein